MLKHLIRKLFHKKHWELHTRKMKRVGYTKVLYCAKCGETHYEYTYLGGF